MRNLSSATLWIVIFLVVILLFIGYAKQDHPQAISLMEWRDKGRQGLLSTSVDSGGKIQGEYWTDQSQTEKIRYMTEYLSGQEDTVLEWVAAATDANGGGFHYETKRKNPVYQTLLFSFLCLAGK